MPKARNGAVELEYETFGDDRPETVLLVNGLGSQMTRWPEAFCGKLVARGYRTIRFDNRDTGLSTWFKPGDRYALKDMAADAMAVLDAAGVRAASEEELAAARLAQLCVKEDQQQKLNLLKSPARMRRRRNQFFSSSCPVCVRSKTLGPFSFFYSNSKYARCNSSQKAISRVVQSMKDVKI